MINAGLHDTSIGPTEELASILHDDMIAVNRIMLNRIRSEVPLIPDLVQYVISAGGKRIRPLLTMAFAALCDDQSEAPKKLAAAVEFVHTATLLHDDVLDGSDLRRGKPAASKVFGNQASVLVGDFLFARASELVVETGSVEALEALARASRVMTEGEVLQMSLAGKADITRDQYFTVIGAKSAALFAAAAEAAPSLQGIELDPFTAYGYNLGMAFQIIDDIMDYKSPGMGKNRGDDFMNAKITLPVIIAIERASSTTQEFIRDNILEPDVGILDDFLMAVASHGAFEESIMIARSHCDEASRSLSTCSGRIADTLRALPYAILDRTV